MEQIIILSNPGSASKKYSVYQNNIEIAWFHFEKQDTEYVCSYRVQTHFEKKFVNDTQYHASLTFVIDSLLQNKIQIESSNSIIGIRTVVPDERFVFDVKITPEYLDLLTKECLEDPLHIGPILDEIRNTQTYFKKLDSVYLISDSSFHVSSSKKIPIKTTYDVHTIGYHGLSVESVLSTLKKEDIEHSKLIVCHLGGGSSITGVKHNKSVYNSMEYSPLSGTFMASRSGSIDPLLILRIMKEKKFSTEQMIDFLYTQSGLFALSGSNDLRIVREKAFSGDKEAKESISLFVNSICSYITKALSYTEGIDTLVFAGTIGYRASYIREMVTDRLKWLGISINHDKNINGSDTCFVISSSESKIQVIVVQIDEMKEMHRHIKMLI